MKERGAGGCPPSEHEEPARLLSGLIPVTALSPSALNHLRYTLADADEKKGAATAAPVNILPCVEVLGAAIRVAALTPQIRPGSWMRLSWPPCTR